MKVITTQDMRTMDQRAIKEFHIPSVLLMEHAAMAVKQHIEKERYKEKEIVILCGPGNNGGDGFALARLLQSDGYEHVTIFCNANASQQSSDEQVYASICEACQIPIVTSDTLEELKGFLQRADLIIDALFGTGLSREIEGFYAELINYVNGLSCEVISIDIASGIHGDTGRVMGCAIQATSTISFACYKRGLVLYPGSQYCGKVYVESIAMPNTLIEEVNGISLIEKQLVSKLLPKRASHSNKGSYGKALMIGGSLQMPGAITLAAKAALASGIGTLTLAIPEGIHAILANKLEECMLLPLPMDQGFFAQEAITLLKPLLSQYQLLIIGNGLGRTPACKALMELVIESELPCILDGDALYLASELPALNQRIAPMILTPHIKEMSYLCHSGVQDILKDPITLLASYQAQHPFTCIVLKDEHTLIQDAHHTYLNIAGNHALAKGGSGDVLCGILAGLFAQSKQPLESCICAVYVHAISADRLVQRKSAHSILPSDIINELSSSYRWLGEEE